MRLVTDQISQLQKFPTYRVLVPCPQKSSSAFDLED